MRSSSALFPRNFRKDYPLAVRGEGCFIFTADGKKYLDAAGQAAVVSIGHGVASVGRAMAEQVARLEFAHTSQFSTPVAENLARRLLRRPEAWRNRGRPGSGAAFHQRDRAWLRPERW